jgi:hypothetical protein
MRKNLIVIKKAETGIPRMGSRPRPAWAVLVIFFRLHNFASHFPGRVIFPVGFRADIRNDFPVPPSLTINRQGHQGRRRIAGTCRCWP